MENFYRGPAILLTGAAEVPVDAALYTETTARDRVVRHHQTGGQSAAVGRTGG
ncbi:hypothetical protein ACWV95_05325 [Streptomyces albus]